ncbi:MAG: hypothetical protein C4344_00650, partial [Acidimicrobiia bacterium]
PPLSHDGRITFGTWLATGAVLVAGAALGPRPARPLFAAVVALAYGGGFVVGTLLGRLPRAGRREPIEFVWPLAFVTVAAAATGHGWTLGVAAAAAGVVAGALRTSGHLRRTDLVDHPVTAAFEVEALPSRRGMGASLARTLPLESGEHVGLAQRVLVRTGGRVRPLGYIRLTDRRIAILRHTTFSSHDRILVVPRAAVVRVATTSNGNWLEVRYRTGAAESSIFLRAAGWGEIVCLGARLRPLAGRVPGTADNTRLHDLLLHWASRPAP